MAKRRPPDILRKSHAHTERKERAQDKQALRDELAESDDGRAEPDEPSADSPERSEPDSLHRRRNSR